MLKLILGLLVGAVGAWAYRSEQTREQIRQQLATAPATFRGGVVSAAAVTTAGVQRVSQVVDATPLPAQAKERARTATAAIQSAADKMKQQATPPSGDRQPPVPPSSSSVLKSLIPEEVLAEQDASTRAAALEQQEHQAGA